MTEFLSTTNNSYNIKILDENEEKINFSIQEDYLFSLKKLDLKLETNDDFLEEICENINKKKLVSQDLILTELTKEYGILIEDEDIPLYEGQDVFEDENDNNDIKFVDRIRFNYEKFNKDIILNILSFQDVADLLKSSLVCKEWFKLSQDELIWKNHLTKMSYPLIDNQGYKSSYINEVKNVYKWDEDFLNSTLKTYGNGMEGKIKITNDGKTIENISTQPVAWFNVPLKKPLKKTGNFAINVEYVQTGYYWTFQLVYKEKNTFAPSSVNSLQDSIYNVNSIPNGTIIGIIFQNESLLIFHNDELKQTIPLKRSDDIYPVVSVVDKSTTSIVKNWKLKNKLE